MKYKDAKIGMKVRMNNNECHDDCPTFYPKKGTIGVIVKAGLYDCVIKWPDNTVCSPYEWCCDYGSLDIVNDDNINMTDEEIWNMLKGKLDKNGIKDCGCRTVLTGEKWPLVNVKNVAIYFEDTLIKAVSLAYRCGYMRAEKGRPFKYGDKK